MRPMTTSTINVRIDEKEREALDFLVKQCGAKNASDAVRRAVLFAARQAKRERMREQSLASLNNPAEQAVLREEHEAWEDASAW